MQEADDVLRLPAPYRQARVRRGQHLAHDLPGRQICADRGHLRAVDHHVGDGQVLEIEKAAEHVAVGPFDAAFLMQQIDRAFQLLASGQKRMSAVGAQSEDAQESVHDSFHRDQNRAERRDEQGGDSRDRQRHAVWIADRHSLRHDLGEDQTQGGHEDCRIDGAALACDRDEHAGRHGGSCDVDERIAEKHRADEAVARLEQLVDSRRARIAITLQRMHARPRSGGQRCLRACKKRRQEDADSDDPDRDPDVHRKRLADRPVHGSPTLTAAAPDLSGSPQDALLQ